MIERLGKVAEKGGLEGYLDAIEGPFVQGMQHIMSTLVLSYRLERSGLSCTLHTAHYTLFNVQCTLHTTHLTSYRELIILCTLHTAQRALQLHLDITPVLLSLQPSQASLSFLSILTLISPVYFLIFPEYIPSFLSHLFPDICT